ncbi:uncharacterized protein LOC120031408 [Salvelinus namaycush]|uniref:Uncharacterized protein LOC120031408 n=1 Tax=Salvelinus namaycush TaxID=8040 RepID=A0A8U0TYG2_SALNM|nr:uncharacterized protein LOC120031408 [Salvelinus namaycush]
MPEMETISIAYKSGNPRLQSDRGLEVKFLVSRGNSKATPPSKGKASHRATADLYHPPKSQKAKVLYESIVLVDSSNRNEIRMILRMIGFPLTEKQLNNINKQEIKLLQDIKKKEIKRKELEKKCSQLQRPKWILKLIKLRQGTKPVHGSSGLKTTASQSEGGSARTSDKATSNKGQKRTASQMKGESSCTLEASRRGQKRAASQMEQVELNSFIRFFNIPPSQKKLRVIDIYSYVFAPSHIADHTYARKNSS